MRMSPAVRRLAAVVLRALYAGGGTALYDGLQSGVRQQMDAEAALRELAEREGSARVSACLLFTDGQATDGAGTAQASLCGARGPGRLRAAARHSSTARRSGY